MARQNELFVVEHHESGQEVGVYGFIPFIVGGESLGGEFLVWTLHGWDFKPVDEFIPLKPKILELVIEDEG